MKRAATWLVSLDILCLQLPVQTNLIPPKVSQRWPAHSVTVYAGRALEECYTLFVLKIPSET